MFILLILTLTNAYGCTPAGDNNTPISGSAVKENHLIQAQITENAPNNIQTNTPPKANQKPVTKPSDSSSSKAAASAGDKHPEWVMQKLVQLKQKKARSKFGMQRGISSSIKKYTYNDQTVYYFSPSTYDGMSKLYDKNHNFICAPDGGITGKGDNKCPDFFSAKSQEQTIWSSY
jgi:hypothetical protein